METTLKVKCLDSNTQFIERDCSMTYRDDSVTFEDAPWGNPTLKDGEYELAVTGRGKKSIHPKIVVNHFI